MSTYREKINELPKLVGEKGNYVHVIHADEVARAADAEIADYEQRITAFREAVEEANRRLDEVDALRAEIATSREWLRKADVEAALKDAEIAKLRADVPAWKPVAVEMPKPGQPVLVSYVTHHTPPRIRINRAHWIPAKFEESDTDTDNFEYDEATDTNWTPAGWYECIDHWDDYSAVAMASVTVTHWMPLPAAPSHISAAAKGEGK